MDAKFRPIGGGNEPAWPREAKEIVVLISAAGVGHIVGSITGWAIDLSYEHEVCTSNEAVTSFQCAADTRDDGMVAGSQFGVGMCVAIAGLVLLAKRVI